MYTSITLTNGDTLDFNCLTGIYRDRNPTRKGSGIIEHWIKYTINGKSSKYLMRGITHAEYTVIKAIAHFNQLAETYVTQEKVTLK